MKASNLHDLWASPDNSRLTSKQFSFRLPTHIAAKIAALCEMYPNKTRTQVVADLLTSALDELEKALPEEIGEEIDPQEQYEYEQFEGPEFEKRHYLGGLRGRFRDLSNRHYQEIEQELGNESPSRLYEERLVTESEMKRD